MSIVLRIQIKSLTFKARELRREENIALHHARHGNEQASFARELFHNLRVGKLRHESRSAHLAYGFLRGMPYSQMERTCRETPDWARIEQIAINCNLADPRETRQHFAQWKDEAEDYIQASREWAAQEEFNPAALLEAVHSEFLNALQNRTLAEASAGPRVRVIVLQMPGENLLGNALGGDRPQMPLYGPSGLEGIFSQLFGGAHA